MTKRFLDGSAHARWGVADQLISSATNFLIMGVAAKWGTTSEFATFGVAFTMYILVLWIARSLVGEPFVVRFTTAAESEQRRAGTQALSAAFVTGSVFGGLMIGFWLVSGPEWQSLAVMGFVMPALMTQDACRYLLLASGRPRDAAMNDAIWLALQCAALGAMALGARDEFSLLAAIFGGAAGVAAAVGLRQFGARVNLRKWRAWFRDCGELGRPFLYEVLGISAMPQITLLIIAGLGSVVTVGAMRAAFLLLGPPSVVCAGILLVGMPEAARVRMRPGGNLLRYTGRLAALTSAVVVLWSAALALVPDEIGNAVLGENWHLGREVLLPVALLTVVNAVALAGVVGLRTMEAVRRSLPIRAAGSVVMVISALAGLAIGESEGAAYGLALGGATAAALTWKCLRDADQQARSGTHPVGVTQPAGAGVEVPHDLV